MHRVVITGYGAISPLGHSANETWKGIVEGQSGLGPITLFDAGDGFDVKHAAEIKNFDPESIFDHKEVRRLDRFQWLGHAAAIEAIQHSGLEITEANNSRIGVAVASGGGGLNSMDEQFATLHANGPKTISPFGITKIMSNGAAGSISIAFGLRGSTFSVASACASGADALGMSMVLIRAGRVDAMVAGGAEAPVTGLTLGAFDRIRAASHRTHDTPSPFSADRDGLIVGEGSGVLILESLEHAKKRGATIYAELAGYGSSADAYHITAPTEDGSGSARAIRQALDDAKVTAEDIQYVNAHGTGTKLNDDAETKAVKIAFGPQAYKVPISSTKSMTGHMMGATGALEAIFCTQAINDGIAPPTINYTQGDEICDLDYVPNEARNIAITVAMSNSFGFGGHNAVLIFKAFRD